MTDDERDTNGPHHIGKYARKVVDQARAAHERARAEGRIAPADSDPEPPPPWQEMWERTIPRRYRTADLDDLPDDIGNPLAMWATDPHQDVLNVILGGAVGVGKTHAAIAAASAWAETHRRTPRFWPMVEMLEALKPDGEDGMLDRLTTCALLVLDDLGADRLTPWASDQLYLVVNRRWLDELPTIGTTNLSGDDLRAAIGERTASRLLGGALTLRLAGDDRRRRPAPTP